MIAKRRIIPAYRVVEQATGRGYLEDYINDILSIINDDIQTSVENDGKKNYSITEIQTQFDIPGMDNKRAQMHVYYHILRALEKSKYIPNLRIMEKNSHQKVFIYVRWFTEDIIKAEQHMNKYIQKHMMR